MAAKRKRIPRYSKVQINGHEYYKTDIEDADGKRVILYGKTREEVYDKEMAALEQIDNATFRRKSPTVAEYCEKWLLMQSVHIRATTLIDYTSKVRRHIIKELGEKRMADVTLDMVALGHQMTIDLLSNRLSSKGDMQLAEGVYTPSNDYVSPMTFTQGSTFNLMGYIYYYGTYIQQVESADATPLIGFAQQGTIEVKRSGDQYEFIVDVTTPEGISMKGTYPMGDVRFVDNAPDKPAGDWLSNLREDKTVLFNPDDESECRLWTYTSYFEGATEFEILVDNNTTDEAFQLDILAPEGATSIAGTYTTPSDPNNPKVGEFIPGYQEFAAKRGTWPYLFYDFDESDYTIGAPATEGTIEIRELEDGKVEIQFEMKDDADPKNTIRSVWSGSIRKIN